MRDEVTRTATDTTVALEFIKNWLEHTEQPAYVCSLANEKNDPNEPNEQRILTRDADQIAAFIAKWDRPARGLFFCVSTIRHGMKRNKENVAEIPGLWADIDFKDVKETPDSILKRVKALPLPPSIIVRSGNGLHLYWRFKEPMIVNIIDGPETIERVEAALKQLADLVGGDMKVTQVAALMRLPGTHNSKRDEWKPVEIETSNSGGFELDEIEDMLAIKSPVVLRKLRPSAVQGEINPFLAAANSIGFRPPIDVEKRLAAMVFMGGGDAAIHDTQISVSASLLSAGVAVEEVVSLVRAATEAAAGDYGKRWNWKKEEREIRNACATWIVKHPEEIEQAQVKKKEGDNIVKPVDIDWNKVEAYAGWLTTAADLPPNFSATGKALVAHTGSIKDLKVDLQRSGVVTTKPISDWSEVAFALTMTLRGDGRLPTEKIAAALLCPLACNQHISKLPNDAEKRSAIERLMWRTQDHVKQEQKAKQERKTKKVAGEPDWRERRLTGTPIPSMHNARLAINALGIKCSRDTFHNKTLFGFRDDTVKHELQSILGEVSDDGVIALRQLMSDKFGFDLEDKATRDAVKSLAIDNCFNPVCDLIDKAQADWDGEKRLDTMAVTHFNCADTPLNRAFLRKTIIAMVARARVPGCKFDTITVLESVEGYNKSTAWRVLAGDENFSDEPIIGKGSREVQEQLSEIWLHENADLAGMKKAEVETVKAFASRTTDIARAAFAHFVVKQLRHSVEVGSTNSEEYLQSQTGNRRFWPLRVLQAIDIAQLKRDRLQLIGEAATYQLEGESITLDEAMWGDAGVQQDKRRIKHPWEAVLAVIHEHHRIADPLHPGDYKVRTILHYLDGEERVSSRDLLTYVLEVPTAYQTTAHTMQLSATMKRLGWERTENKITIEKEQVRGFFRKQQLPAGNPEAESGPDDGIEEL
jgi:predicted P-loop ATPase